MFEIIKILFSLRGWRNTLAGYKTYIVLAATLLGLGASALNDIVIPILDGADILATVESGKWILTAMSAGLAGITGKAGINRLEQKIDNSKTEY